MSGNKQLLCVECAKLHNPAQFCPVHPDEPLLDPEDDDVRFELISLDDKARSRTYTRWMVGLGAIGLGLAIATLVAVGNLVNEAVGAFWREIVGGGVAGGGFIGFIVAKARYRPRFRKWTREQ